MSFTDYLENDLCISAGISLRQLARIRASDKLPDGDTLQKLSRAIPQLQPLAERAVSVARLTWQAVEWEQDKLPKGSTIALVLGIEPRAIAEPNEHDQLGISEPDRYGRRMAQNVIDRKIAYSLFCPVLPPSHHSHDTHHEWLKALHNRVLLQALQLNMPAELRGVPFAKLSERITDGIRLFETKLSDTALYFWSRAPRYVALYNIGAPGDSTFAQEQYGMFWEHGEMPYPHVRTRPHIPNPIKVEGWTYLPEEDYKDLCELILKMVRDNSLQPGGNYEFPIPGRNGHPPRARRKK
jgi:hypothetical protein